MRHTDHEPGTREDCEECRALAYEPGWYKALRHERLGPPDPTLVRLPDPEDTEVEAVDESSSEPARRHR